MSTLKSKHNNQRECHLTNLESRNLASGLKLEFEFSSLFCCFFLLSVSEFAFCISSGIVLPMVNKRAASSCRSFNEESFELQTICLLHEFLYITDQANLSDNAWDQDENMGKGREIMNLANCWSKLFTRPSQDPGFLRSIFMSEFVTARTTDPSGSSAMAYIIHTK